MSPILASLWGLECGCTHKLPFRDPLSVYYSVKWVCLVAMLRKLLMVLSFAEVFTPWLHSETPSTQSSGYVISGGTTSLQKLESVEF